MAITISTRVRALGLAVVLSSPALVLCQPVPPELTSLAVKAHLDAPIVAWCRAQFREGHPGAFALAVRSPGGGGRYVALDTDGTATELARFEAGPDLACYSRAQAEKLSADISRSETIEGHIAPRWSTTVVCAFTENTAAVCWQYSPTDRKFVQVGQWVT